MIDTVIFDIGKVLIEWDWKQYLDQFDYSKEKKERLAKAMFLNPVWEETDRGVWSDEEILNAFAKEAPEYREEITLLWNNMQKCVWRKPYTDQWIADLKKDGKKVYYLSNYGRTLREKTKEALAFTENCDGGIFSYEVNLIKPDLAIYKALLEKYNLDTSRCVFIDDLEKNIQGAKSCGMDGIWFIDYPQARRLLEEKLKGDN